MNTFLVTSFEEAQGVLSYFAEFHDAYIVSITLRLGYQRFLIFVTKPNIRQPLFTQYCDGKRVNCEIGMQQWGSKDLGY